MQLLRCAKCEESQSMPQHCGQNMHLEKVEGQPMLVCHMGPTCGKQELPKHHDAPMLVFG